MTLRIPEDGLDNQIFDHLTDQAVHVMLVFEKPYPETADNVVLELLQDWLPDEELWVGCDAPGKTHAYMHQTSLSSAGIVFTLVNTAHPRRPLATLVKRLADAGHPMREELYGVIEWGDDRQERPSRHPDMAPLAQVDSIDSYWTACFDHDGPAPDSELHHECYEQPSEMRLSRLHVPGLRICYATPTPSFLDASPRGEEVLRAIDGAVRAAWAPLMFARRRVDEPEQAPVPTFLDRDGQLATQAERIYRSGRAGYSLACVADDLRADYPRQYGNGRAFRFREHELMYALRTAIRELDLDPVVMWRRFRSPNGSIGHVELQLWEKPDAPATRAARDEIAARRAALIESGELTVLPTLEPVPAAPASDPSRAQLPDGRTVIVGPCAVKVIGGSGKERVLLRGIGYQQVVVVAGGLAVVRGAIGGVKVEPGDPDGQVLYRERGIEPPDRPVRLEAPAALYLVDPDAAEPLLQTIPSDARQIASVEDGNVVVVARTSRDDWRSAVLAVRGRRLRVVATLRASLADLRAVDGRLVSSDGVELLNARRAAEGLTPTDEEPDVSALAPEEPGRWQLPSPLRVVYWSDEEKPPLPTPSAAVAKHVGDDDRYIASAGGGALIHKANRAGEMVGLSRVTADGKVVEVVKAGKQTKKAVAFPSISRDGKRALYTRGEGEELWLLDVETGHTRKLEHDATVWGTAPDDDGRLALLADETNLQLAELDGDTVQVIAETEVPPGILEGWGGGRLLVVGGLGAEEIVVLGCAGRAFAPIATFPAGWNFLIENERLLLTSDQVPGALELVGLEAAWRRFADWVAKRGEDDSEYPEHVEMNLFEEAETLAPAGSEQHDDTQNDEAAAPDAAERAQEEE